jgi:cardiolipin synthase
LIPIYITLYLGAENNTDLFLAASILAVSCLTDLIDGKIARHFNMISNVGKILDPLADKLTQFSLIICLLSKYKTLIYIVPLFVIKESFQLIAGGISIKNGRMLKGAQLTGKISTTVLFLSLIILVLMNELPETTVLIITLIDCIVLFIAFIDYILVYFKKSSKFQELDINE